MVVAAIKEDKLKEQQKQRKLNRAMRTIQGNADADAQLGAISAWASRAAAELKAAYDRLMTKYQRAMLCGRKYEWTTCRCVDFGAKIESTVKDIPTEDQADAALDMVVAAIKEDKLKEQQKQRKLNRAMRTIQGNADADAQLGAISAWASRAAAELKAAYDRLMTKYQRAMLCGVKYEWPRSRCVSFGARIESELQAKGINDPQKQAAAALEMVIAQIKQDKASAISNLKSELEPATTSKSNQSSSRKQSKQRAPLRL